MYMYKEDLALNNLQWLICHKTKPNYFLFWNLLFFYLYFLFRWRCFKYEHSEHRKYTMLRISLRRCVTFGIFICFVAGMFLGFRFITRDVVSDDNQSADEKKGNVRWKLSKQQFSHNHSQLLATSPQKSLLNKMLEFRARMHKERILKSKLRSNNTFFTTPPPRQTTIPFDENGLNYNVHVFYYMWYGNPQNDGKYFHWNHRLLQNWREKVKRAMVRRHFPPLDIASNYYPELGPYSSSNSEVLSIHMEQIKNAGIGKFF